MTDYYQRAAITYLDGTPIFKTAQDEQSEADVARALTRLWNCEFHSFGKLSLIDWYAVRTGRLVGIAELKTRSHERAKYPTVFLNVRKWLALTVAAAGLGVPAVFVVRFSDGTYFVNVSEIDASNVKIGGCRQIVKARNDIEPIIEVPVDILKPI